MRKQTHWLCAALFLSLAVSVMAQEYTSRQEVLQNEALVRDFTIQGEYLTGEGTDKMGLHIIADGGGSFRVVTYKGGLPGDGWKKGDDVKRGTAKLDGDNITFTIDRSETKGKVTVAAPQAGGQGTRQQGAGQGTRQPGAGGQGFRGTPVTITFENPTVTWTRQNRQSPTLNARAPEGAVVLFDGTNLDKFLPGAKMNEVQTQRPAGAGQGGAQRGNQNTLWAEAATPAFEKKPYTLHIEFMLSYMPQARGQGRSNSGVYVDERYECQVLDSFGLDSKNDDCGGFYQIAAPLVNMCFPPLTWQTYDIDFTPPQWDGNRKTANARVTVKHNGVVIHDNVELTNNTPGRKNEGPEPLGVYLQGHGNKVQYRNIWLQYK